MSASFKDLADVFQVSTAKPAPVVDTATEEAAFGLRAIKDMNSGLEKVVCRVFGQPGKPALVDLDTRSVYPTKD